MVTLKEYEAYLKVKRIIDSCDEAEIISKLENIICRFWHKNYHFLFHTLFALVLMQLCN